MDEVVLGVEVILCYSARIPTDEPPIAHGPTLD
jgi:hypothetical protein